MPRGLRIGHATDKRLASEVAAFLIAGSDASLNKGRSVEASGGLFSVVGSAAGLIEPFATAATISGPVTGIVNTSNTYAITLDGAPPIGLVLTPTATGGVIGTIVQTGTATYSFTFTAIAAGDFTIGLDSTPFLAANTITVSVAPQEAFIATFSGPSVVELYKPQTYYFELNQQSPGGIDVLLYKNNVLIRSDSIRSWYGWSFKDVEFTSAEPETIEVRLKYSATTSTFPLPTIVGSPITVTKPNATRLDILGTKGGKPGTWVRFAIQPNGPIGTAFSAALYPIAGADQTTVYPATVSWTAGSVGRKEFWVYRHTPGVSKLRLVNSSGFDVVETDDLIFNDGSWADRAFRPSVLFGNNFANYWEMDLFAKSEPNLPEDPAPVERVLTDIGWAIRQKSIGATLIEDVPSCPSYYANKTTPEVARQVWKVSTVAKWPTAFPYKVIVGISGSTKEYVLVEGINTETNEITLLRRVTGDSYSYLGVSYPNTTCAPFKGDGTVNLGDDGSGGWERPMAALRIDGIGDDVGITNGSARKIRDWPPFNKNGVRVTNRADRNSYFLEGYWGHRSYWDPAYGTAEYKDWWPVNRVTLNDFPRIDAFEGQSCWLQFRSRLDLARLNAGEPKHFFIQNDLAGSGQFVWTAGGVNGVGNPLVAFTSFDSASASLEPHRLTMPPSGVVSAKPDRIQHQESYPLCNNTLAEGDRVCWTFPADKWVTYMIHFDFGRCNAKQPYTNAADAEAAARYIEPAVKDTDYRTGIKIFVAEEGDTTWKRIIDYPNYAWVFGDDKEAYGKFRQNPPGLSLLQFGSYGNVYLGSGGSQPEPFTTEVEFTDFILSREPIPIPNVGTMPSDYIPEPAVPPSFTPSPPVLTGHYTDGMQPFEVRFMTGAYAPLGAETFRASQPPPWNGSARYQTEGILSAWSGGVYDPSTKRLFFSGGGHSDGANNGWHVFDWSGTAKPVGFSTLPGSRSEFAAVDPLASYWYVGEYLDGKPNAVHTYSNTAFSVTRNRLYRGNSGGVVGTINNGQEILAPDAVYWFDIAAGTYGKVVVENLIETGGFTVLSPDESTLYVWPAHKYINIDTGVSTSGQSWFSSGGQSALEPTYAYDSVNDRYLCLNYKDTLSSRAVSVKVNWGSRTVQSTSAYHSSQDNLLYGGMAMVFDAEQMCFWCIGAGKGSNLITDIVRVDANTFEAAAFPLSVSITENLAFHYRRVAWMPEHRALGLIVGHTLPAVVIKLP